MVAARASRSAPLLRGLALFAVFTAAGCDSAPQVTSPSASGSALPAPSAAVAVNAPLDPSALDEIVANVPAPLPATSASGTLVGTDTGITGSEKPDPETDDAGLVSLLPNWAASNAGSERDLRGTLYFDLVNRCRDEGGAQLPPEAVELELRIDLKGHIDRSSVKARALRPEHAKAAACMARVARTSEALLTPPRLDKPVMIKALVPSVD
jgi:hypothetical protein